MILPNKYIFLNESLIGLSAFILDIINNKTMTIEEVWEKFEKKYILKKKIKNPPTFQKFLYAVEFMYIAKMIDYNSKGEIYNENIKS